VRTANRKQALVPEGADVIDPAGTAPGLVVPPLNGSGPTVVVLPGPPRELHAMWPHATETEAFRHAIAGRTEYSQDTLRLFGIPESEIAETLRLAEGGGVPGFEQLNTWYYADAPKTIRPQLESVRRQSTFDEVVGGLDASTALFEARRCMSCGSCFACDNCYGVCPDNAVIKLDPTGSYAYEIDYEFCKGCGLCAQECPCGAIEMEPERI